MRFKLSLINEVVSYYLLLFILLNRWASKINIGPIYLLDITILMSILISPFKWFIAMKSNYPVMIMIVFSSVWLLNDFINAEEMNAEILRRYALSVYYLVPVMYVVILQKITLRYFHFITILLVSIIGMSFLYAGEIFRVSLLSESLGLFFLHAVLTQKKKDVGYLITVILGGVFFVSVFHTSILGQGGVYKTPIAAFGFSILIVWLYSFAKSVLGYKINLKRLFLVINVLVLLFFIGLFTNIGHLIIAEILNGLGGLFGADLDWQFLHDWSAYRSRASSFGTASTRVQFWSEIIKYSLIEPWRILIGNGHQFSFMEVVDGDFCSTFLDCKFIEPHNSFIGIYFRYGLLGLLLFFWLMYLSRRFLERRGYTARIEILLACGVYAMVYASFEVALESPHGALLFWFIWLSPYFLDMQIIQKNKFCNNINY